MTDWKWLTFILCCFGFIKEFRPIEPFYTAFLIDVKNISNTVLDDEVNPFWTYSYLIFLVPVFVFTDLLKYKPIVISGILAYMLTWLILALGTTAPHMELMQTVYGWGSAAEVAYFSYIYAMVDKQYYQKATSFVRGASLGGRFISYTTAQLIISFASAGLVKLAYISLGSMALVSILAIFLPSVQSNSKNSLEIAAVKEDGAVYHIQSSMLTYPIAPDVKQPSWFKIACEYMASLFSKAKQSYSNGLVLKWSIWWAFATCGQQQVGNYTQNIWAEIYGKDGSQDLYNGVAEAANSLLGNEVNWDSAGGTVTLLQSKFIAQMLEKYGMKNANAVRVPMDPGLKWYKLSKEKKPEVDQMLYQSAVSSLLYAAISTRPDISAAVGVVSQSASNPRKEHWLAVKGIFRYLKGTIAAILVQFLHVRWELIGEIILAIISATDAILLIVISRTSSLTLAYCFYVAFNTLYQMLITIATFNIVSRIAESSYGLIIGCNTFIALILQTILTVIVNDKSVGLEIPIRTQFLIYGLYFGCIAIVFLITGMITILKFGCRRCLSSIFISQESRA